MHILVTGAAGMIGRKLTERLAKDGALHGRAIEKLTLADVVAARPPPRIAAVVDIVGWLENLKVCRQPAPSWQPRETKSSQDEFEKILIIYSHRFGLCQTQQIVLSLCSIVVSELTSLAAWPQANGGSAAAVG